LPGRHRFSFTERHYEFPVERAVFLTVLHRLVAPGSDRAAERWRRDYAIEGVAGLELHHLYRAMGWLGEPRSESEQGAATPFAPRCTKDLIEEELFARRRDLFTTLELVFFDTTSIYFEGAGGESLGQYGHSKDHRPDLKQMVVGVVIDSDGHPICCELWPGNTTDVRTLVPIVERLRRRFGMGEVCLVADRGMISSLTLEELEKRHWGYILGAPPPQPEGDLRGGAPSGGDVIRWCIRRAGMPRIPRHSKSKRSPSRIGATSFASMKTTGVRKPRIARRSWALCANNFHGAISH
jgi:hypothetical protein